MKLIFNDSQELQIQIAYIKEERLCIRMLHKSLEELKLIFGDEFATKTLTVYEGQESVTYENYTQFHSITEECGGILEVELVQSDKPLKEKLLELQETVNVQAALLLEQDTLMKEQVSVIRAQAEGLTKAAEEIEELKEIRDKAEAQMTDMQIAICELYEGLVV